MHFMLSKNKTISGKQNHTKCAIENIKHFLAVEYLKKKGIKRSKFYLSHSGTCILVMGPVEKEGVIVLVNSGCNPLPPLEYEII